MHLSSFVPRLLVPCALSAVFLFTFCAPARAGIVNIVSQDSSITIDVATGNKTQHSTTLDGFTASLTYTYPQINATSFVSQTSVFTPTDTGGETFTSTDSTTYTPLGGESRSIFNVTFDLSAPASYAFTYSEETGRGGESGATLQGPSGKFQIVGGIPPELTGDLAPGQYTLSSGSNGGTSYNLRLDISPSTAAVPLPAALWTALPIMLLLSAASFLHSRRRSQSASRLR